jgi:two-component system, NtrC family, sensor kinase
MVPDALPIVFVLAVLVIALFSVQRLAPSVRVRLWAYGWALIGLHFCARSVETHSGAFEKVLNGTDIACLLIAGIVFLSSMGFRDEDRRKRTAFLVLMTAPATAYAFASAFNWEVAGTALCFPSALFLIAIAFALVTLPRRASLNVAAAIALAGIGALAVNQQLAHRNAWFALSVILALLYGLTGVFFWRLYQRRTLGVMAVTAGFLGWAAVYPMGLIMFEFSSQLSLHLDVWNIPRFFVAFGMVITLLEDKTRVIEQTSALAQAENQLLDRLSQITSRLLAGKDPLTLCGEVAAAVADASSFRCAALFLVGDDRKLHQAGSKGFQPEETAELQRRAGDDACASLRQLCAAGSRIGNNSFLLCTETNLVLIPLTSWRGSPVGCLCLAGWKGLGEANASELMKLEVFASDLAVTIENVRLHQQLVQAEKLSSLGQLVAGVAHELNNPLTGIIGYTDLLADEIAGQHAAKRVEKLGSEARRMKRIVDGLLRFARQNNSATRAASVETAFHDVIQLREYHMRKRSIQVELKFETILPPAAIGEDELKQILLNLLNNAIDAVEESAHREIRIRGSHQSGRIAIAIEDSGPGFADLNRAFDPFYTTKPVGKGTGLGLSICYGVVQECGGKIALSNRQPYGASVMIDLPAAVPGAAPSLIGSASIGVKF